ncbi:Threonyl/alanyl tRNA synthetase, partial [Russula brevipes]
VDGELWDLERPLEKSIKLELLDFEHPEGEPEPRRSCFVPIEPTLPLSGKKVFWHSSAHVLGEATERHYGCHLCLGPPTDDGFFYEMAINDSRVITNADYPLLEKVVESAIKDRQKFERLVVSKDKLLEMFHVSREARFPNLSPL